MADRQLKVTLVGDTKNLDRALGRAETRLQRFGRAAGGSKGGKLGALASGGGLGTVGKAGFIGAGIAAGTAVTVKALSTVVKAAEDAQVAQAGLDQAFAASGKSQAKYGKQVDETIQSVSKLAGIDDEEVSRNFANLLRTTGSIAKATKDVGLAANIARARNISLAAASKIVEKAENGQLRGLKSLGVQIDKNTTSSEAIDRAQRKFAGSAEAYGKTAAGAQDKLGVAFENVQEKLGKKLLPIVTKLSLRLIDFIDWSERNWPKFAKAVGDAYRDAKPFIDNFIARIKDVVAIFRGVVNIIQGIANGKWSQVWAGIKQIAVKQIDLIYHAFLELPLKLAKALGGKALDGLRAVGRAIGNAIRDGVLAVINKLIDDINGVGGLLNKALPGNPVPKLGKVGGSGSSASPRQAPPIQGERHTSSVTINVNGAESPEATARAVNKELQRTSRFNSVQGRGRIAGKTLGVN